jgi:hypothetical protein
MSPRHEQTREVPRSSADRSLPPGSAIGSYPNFPCAGHFIGNGRPLAIGLLEGTSLRGRQDSHPNGAVLPRLLARLSNGVA